LVYIYSLENYDKINLTNFDYAMVIKGANFDIYRFGIIEKAWMLRAFNISKEDAALNVVYSRYKLELLTI
jgi:hypothetical protein